MISLISIQYRKWKDGTGVIQNSTKFTRSWAAPTRAIEEKDRELIITTVLVSITFKNIL